jgi:hypothetical protein
MIAFANLISARWRIALAALVCLLAAPAMADGLLTPHTARYKVKISIVSGELDTELLAVDGGYKATHTVRATGLSRVLSSGSMVASSEFVSTPDGVLPIRYHSEDTVRNKDPEENITFDWVNLEASGTVGDEQVLIPLDGISHDNVSIQYELMHDLLTGQMESTYVLFDVDKMRVADVTNIGTKVIKVGAGKFEAVGIQHQKEGSSRITTLWCAADLGYLPVVIEQHRKGKRNFRATLEEYTPTVVGPLSAKQD